MNVDGRLQESGVHRIGKVEREGACEVFDCYTTAPKMDVMMREILYVHVLAIVWERDIVSQLPFGANQVTLPHLLKLDVSRNVNSLLSSPTTTLFLIIEPRPEAPRAPCACGA